MSEGNSHRPQDGRWQPVRVGHVVQVERVCRGDAWDDPDFFDPEKHQDRPHHVHKLHGKKQNPKWDRLLPGFTGEAGSVVTDEHGFTPGLMAGYAASTLA